MVLILDFRTDDNSKWGTGNGADLLPEQVDNNFWKLYTAIQDVESAQRNGAGIDYMQLVGGNQLYVHLTDHRVLGPFTIPATVWRPRGVWQPLTNYFPLDVTSDNGALYITNVAHTSAATFSPNATDGLSHDLYTLLLTQPQDMLPNGGTIGQRLAKASGSPYATQWETDHIRLAPQIMGQPTDSETVMRYAVTDHMTLPSGLTGSVAYAATPAAASAEFDIEQNGTFIGSITFLPSGGPTVNFATDVAFTPGDIITIVAPSPPDAALADISFTLRANLTE